MKIIRAFIAAVALTVGASVATASPVEAAPAAPAAPALPARPMDWCSLYGPHGAGCIGYHVTTAFRIVRLCSYEYIPEFNAYKVRCRLAVVSP